jgi:hypothetical protein
VLSAQLRNGLGWPALAIRVKSAGLNTVQARAGWRFAVPVAQQTSHVARVTERMNGGVLLG